MLEIKIIDCNNHLKNYAFFIIDKVTNDCALIDTLDTEIIYDYLQKNNLNLKYILNTHHHNDHIGGNMQLKSLYPECRIYAHKLDEKRISSVTDTVIENDIIKLFNNQLLLKVITLDGHTIGHVGFYAAEQKWLFSGDTIFNIGCGKRFEGSSKDFYNTLRKIANLPDDTFIYASHEYTFDNIAFAKTLIQEDFNLYQEFTDYCTLQIDKHKRKEPTIPFSVKSQKKFNPFLLCDDEQIKKFMNYEFSTSPHIIFEKMRYLKDVF